MSRTLIRLSKNLLPKSPGGPIRFDLLGRDGPTPLNPGAQLVYRKSRPCKAHGAGDFQLFLTAVESPSSGLAVFIRLRRTKTGADRDRTGNLLVANQALSH